MKQPSRFASNEQWNSQEQDGFGGDQRPFSYFRKSEHRGTVEKPILVIEDVFKFFKKDLPTLSNINLVVERGEFVFITGPSGSGKSTLLQLIFRKMSVDEGHIWFLGKEITGLSKDQLPTLRRNLGVVFQDFKVVGHWTVYENVAVALEIRGMNSRVIRSRVAEALSRVGLRGRGEDRVDTLSGGEQQRVAIARAIVTEPALLLADEPTGNLDPHLAVDILTLFEEINAAGTTVLFATHDHSLLEKRSHRIVVIEDGEISEMERGLSDYKHRARNLISEISEIKGRSAHVEGHNVIPLRKVK